MMIIFNLKIEPQLIEIPMLGGNSRDVSYGNDVNYESDIDETDWDDDELYQIVSQGNITTSNQSTTNIGPANTVISPFREIQQDQQLSMTSAPGMPSGDFIELSSGITSLHNLVLMQNLNEVSKVAEEDGVSTFSNLIDLTQQNQDSIPISNIEQV
jgi:hypothetical protein